MLTICKVKFKRFQDSEKELGFGFSKCENPNDLYMILDKNFQEAKDVYSFVPQLELDCKISEGCITLKLGE